MEIEQNEKVLLAEYLEAGTICRWYEQLTRTTMSIAIPGLTALCAYIQTASTLKPSTLVVLSLGGILFCLLSINMILRQRSYYSVYINRAKEIETKLGMQLYDLGSNAKMPCYTFSNKLALCWALALFVAYFFTKIILAVKCGL